MDPVGGSGPSEQYSEPTSGRGRRAEVDMCSDICSPPHHASSTSSFAASPTQVLGVRQSSAVFTSAATKSVRRTSRCPILDGPDLCSGMRGMDFEACEPSNYRHHHQVVGPPEMENLMDPAEILAQWTQLIPDEAFEQCFQLDDLDSLLADCSGVDMELPSSDSGTPENSESPSVNVGDREMIRDNQTMITTSSDSVGTTSTRRSAARKRKCRAGNLEAAGDDSGSRPKHSMDAGEQGRHLRKRLSSSSDQSTRYAIETRTDVDVIDDGYRWRKYGQKPVKNSDHPRNYYRCTALNCPVRKQVERCTDNPRNVLTTYDHKHNHPKNPSPSTRESVPSGNYTARGDFEDLPSSTAPIRHHDGLPGPPRLPPTNYMSHNLLDHMLTGAHLLDRTTTRWPSTPPPPQGGPCNNIDLLRAQQLFMLQYQKQYPFLSSMLNLMHNYSLAQPPSFLVPSFALLAAQNYGMRLRDASRNPAFHAPAPLSRSQHRILRMQELMGEQRYRSEHASQQQ